MATRWRRDCPETAHLADAFRVEVTPRQRRSDGTVSLEGQRFEIPARYQHLDRVPLRYARWDRTRVDLVDPRTGTVLCPGLPLDEVADPERMLKDLGAASDLRYVSLRCSNVAGADPQGGMGQATPEATHLIKVACQAVIDTTILTSSFGMPWLGSGIHSGAETAPAYDLRYESRWRILRYRIALLLM